MAPPQQVATTASQASQERQEDPHYEDEETGDEGGEPLNHVVCTGWGTWGTWTRLRRALGVIGDVLQEPRQTRTAVTTFSAGAGIISLGSPPSLLLALPRPPLTMQGTVRGRQSHALGGRTPMQASGAPWWQSAQQMSHQALGADGRRGPPRRQAGRMPSQAVMAAMAVRQLVQASPRRAGVGGPKSAWLPLAES